MDPETGHAYAASRVHATWNEARAACEAQSGHLATITSLPEQEFVVGNFKGLRLWLGGSDAGAEGDWRWITGEALALAVLTSTS